MDLINILSLGIARAQFSNLDLSIRRGDRIGLVGANGCGKSTLLGCLIGTIEPSEGTVVKARNLRISLMSQDIADLPPDMSLRDVAIDGLPAETRDWEGWRAEIVLDQLEVPAVLRERPIAHLSGGWQRVGLLARALVSEPDVLLMDEPTNHLDLARIGQLRRWVASLSRDTTLVIASHDRAFLDHATTRTVFLRNGEARCFDLGFDAARAALTAFDAAAARRFEVDMKHAAGLRRQAAKLNNIAINSGSDLLTVKTKQLKARAERIESDARAPNRQRTAGRIRLDDAASRSDSLVSLDDAEIASPDGTLLFRTGALWIRPGDRICLLGANGSGKSTFVRILADRLRGAEVDGISSSPSLVPGICHQSLEHLDPAETPLETLGRAFTISDHQAAKLLAGAGIAIEFQSRPVAMLSGGLRTRLAMLVLRLERPSFYLLDEPTNHLDIEGQETLEAELRGGVAGCLIVSHDQRFVENVGTRFWEIDRRRLIEVDSARSFFAKAMAASP